MSVSPVSLDSHSLNAVIARLAGARRAPVAAIASSEPSRSSVFRPGLEPVHGGPADGIAGQRAGRRSVDGDLFEPSSADPRDAHRRHAGDEHNHAPDEASPNVRTASQLSQEEQQQLAELRATDAEVRAHEAAHLGAAGGLAQGGASFETTTGPDGREYAIGGEVAIDTSPGATPEETIQKAQRIRKAALAPANPSSQDRAVAAKAAQMEANARTELAEEQDESNGAASNDNASNDNPSSDSSVARVEQASSSARVGQRSANDSLAQRFDLMRSLLGSSLDLVA